MSRYSTYSDDYYLNLNLNTEMDLPANRETVLHFFEQIQKKYPSMRNFYSRDRGEFVLEAEKERGHYRWATIEPRRICSGHVNPQNIKDATDQHRLILDLMPYMLSVSPLDCESLNLMMGFDYNYRGNHNQLVAEVLGLPPALENVLEVTQGSVVAFEPSLQIALDPECRTQVRVSVETRTGAYQVRTGEYPEEQISVYLTARRFGSLDANETYVEVLQQLQEICVNLVDNYMVEHVLQPLQQAIALQ